MPIVIKNNEQIEKMRISGNIVARTFEELKKYVKPGVSTFELDKIAEEFIRSNDAIPSFKGYRGFKGSICASINEEIIHGIPNKKRVLRDGDIISIDIGAYKNSFHGDAARTFLVGNVSEEIKKLVEETEKSFFYGVEKAIEGEHVFTISERVEEYANKFGYGVVREYTGHGIGSDLHEMPEVPNYKQNRKGPKLSKGMTIAVEPMINLGTHRIKTLADGWTVVTDDKLPSAHYENTILITDGKPEILTLL